jgi:hypothetical protein
VRPRWEGGRGRKILSNAQAATTTGKPLLDLLHPKAAQFTYLVPNFYIKIERLKKEWHELIAFAAFL